MLGSQRFELLVEAQHDQYVDAGGLDQPQPLAGGRQVHPFDLGPQHQRRMRVKRNRRAATADRVRALDYLFEQVAVPEMHAVELADRQDDRLFDVCLTEVVDDLHSEFPSGHKRKGAMDAKTQGNHALRHYTGAQ